MFSLLKIFYIALVGTLLISFVKLPDGTFESNPALGRYTPKNGLRIRDWDTTYDILYFEALDSVQGESIDVASKETLLAALVEIKSEETSQLNVIINSFGVDNLVKAQELETKIKSHALYANVKPEFAVTLVVLKSDSHESIQLNKVIFDLGGLA